MKRTVPSCVLVLLALAAPGFSAEQPKKDSETAAAESQTPSQIKGPPLPEIVTVRDKFFEEIKAYQQNVRQLFDDSRFDELEALAGRARTTKARFAGNGAWQIMDFYKACDCRTKDPDSTWQLHDDILAKWIKAKPQSVTARVAQADFLTSYAWRARGDGYADTVTAEGARLFHERLAAAQAALTAARKLEPKCMMWWRNQMVVALGEGWERARYEKLYAEAKAFEPEFFAYDIRHAEYLMPRWHGEPGDWEAAAEKDIARPGLGLEGYARVVMDQNPYYKNIFRDSKASWPKTRAGLEAMRRKYPEWHQLVNKYALLACLAGDRPTAQKLFAEIGGRIDGNTWYSQPEFIRYRNWTYDEKDTEVLEYF